MRNAGSLLIALCLACGTVEETGREGGTTLESREAQAADNPDGASVCNQLAETEIRCNGLRGQLEKTADATAAERVKEQLLECMTDLQQQREGCPDGAPSATPSGPDPCEQRRNQATEACSADNDLAACVEKAEAEYIYCVKSGAR
jgi:hypothetical protein